MFVTVISIYGKEDIKVPGNKLIKTKDRGVKYPLIPGHEIAGKIETVGDKVIGFSKNDKVLVFPWIGEGICPCMYNRVKKIFVITLDH